MVYWIIGLLLILGIIGWVVYRDTHRFVIRRYTATMPGIRSAHKLVFLTDLHSVEYGEGNRRLLDAIREEAPEAILAGGDMIVGRDAYGDDPNWSRVSEELLGDLAKNFPVLLAAGNHEMQLLENDRMSLERLKEIRERYEAYEDRLLQSGVTLLHDRRTALLLGEDTVEVLGVDIPDRYYKKFRYRRFTAKDIRDRLSDPAHPSILMAHHPRFAESYAEYGPDLTLSGHVHGAVMRLPWIGGVISPDPILFPRYSGGSYRVGEMQLIVSCGLGTHTLPLRFFNPAELTVIELVPEEA